MRNPSYRLTTMALFLCTLMILALGGCGSSGSSDSVGYWGGTGDYSTPVTTGFGVSGKIISPVTLAPIQGMNCTLRSTSGSGTSRSYTSMTDAQGAYSFTGVPAGTYRLVTTKEGHVTDNSFFTVTRDMVINQTSLRKDEWTSVMGADHPYDATQAYVSAAVDTTGGGTPAVKNMGVMKGTGKDGVAIDLFSNSKNKGSGYQQRCYFDTQGKADWNATATSDIGVACFYKTAPDDTYTMKATKTGQNFDDVTSITPVKGEFTNYLLRAPSTAVQRVVSMRPLKGMCYSPNPDAFQAGQKPWTDADFCNEDFKEMWGPANRDDIGNLQAIGVNFLHLYDWSRQGTEGYWNGKRDHTSFFAYVEKKTLKMAYPISAWFVGRAHGSLPGDGYQFDEATMSGFMGDFVADAYPGGTHRPCVTMFALGNEYDLGSNGQNAEKVASIIQKIVNAEKAAGISDDEKLAFTAPVSTATKPVWYNGSAEGECVIALRELRKELVAKGLGDIWKTRFIVAINPFQNADGLKTRIETQYPAMLKSVNDGDQMYYCFFESGWPEYGDTAAQGAMYDSQLSTMLPYAKDAANYFLGPCVLEAVNVKFKGTPDGTHGIYSMLSAGGLGQGTTSNGEKYPLDSWKSKPNYDSVKKNYMQP